jgi:hypothetical protein
VIALRERLPWVVWILVFAVALMVAGFACACVTGKAAQASQQVVQSLPPLVEVWALLASVSALVVLFVTTSRRARGRASPALLQRFLL